MLIVITRDPDVIRWANLPISGAMAWGRLKILSAGSQEQATAQMKQYLKLVDRNEPLCITGHGNDYEVGDEGSGPDDWSWSNDEMAELLSGLVNGYKGPILMEVCSNSVTDFSANLVVSLEKLKALDLVWIYGYNKGVGITHPFPKPANLTKNIELTGKQVVFEHAIS